MKKKIAILILLALVMTVNAQVYRESFGGIVGTLDGISYKQYVKGYEHFAFQFDAYWQWGYHPKGVRVDYSIDGNLRSFTESTYISSFPKTQYQAAMVSFSFLQQKEFAVTSKGVWNWYIGGGFGLGACWGYGMDDISLQLKPSKTDRPWLKCEQHLLGGVEYCFKSHPLVLGVDLRPGMAENFQIKGFSTSCTEIRQFAFDWGVNMTVRYYFGKSKGESKGEGAREVTM